jgi:lysine N6-hydroxylase
MRSETIFDVAGIGIGPFNLGMAALCQPISNLSAIFLDQRAAFCWHEGMMIPGTTLQVPYLADLVTLAHPSSPFSYLSYLRAQNRLLQFAVHESAYITRSEYNRYCNWVATQLTSLRFNTLVRSISYNCRRDYFEIEAENKCDQKSELFLARHLVIGTGSTPFIPAELSYPRQSSIFHSSAYLFHKASVINSKVITVVGSGQSAAEIIFDLLNTVDLAHTAINWITRSDRFYSMEISKFAYEMASPDYINFFYGLDSTTKAQLLERQFSLYKGINHQLIDAIYNRLYELINEGTRYNVQIRTQSKLTQINVGADKELILDFYHSGLKESFQIHSSTVILATGYQSSLPKFLNPLHYQFKFDEKGLWQVNRNYSIDNQDRIFVQNMEMHTHGFNAPDLGLGAHRNAIIINTILGREVYPIDKGTSFQQF